MKNNTFKNTFLIFILFLISSCYNYDGPTRIIKKRIPQTPKKIEVKKISKSEYLNEIKNVVEKQLPEAQVEIFNDSLSVLFPNQITYNSSSILPNEDINPKLKKLSSLILKFNLTNLIVTGHTDNKGNAEDNKTISSLRAKYIYDNLIYFKTPADRLHYWGLGDSSPLKPNTSEENRIQNRRIEFIILATLLEE